MSTTQTPQIAFAKPLDDGDAAEDRALAHLRQADEGERAVEVEPAGEARNLGHRLPATAFGIDQPRLPLPDSKTQSRPSYQRGECGIDSPRSTICVAVDVHQETAAPLLARQPPARVGLAQGRDVPRAAVDHRQAVQMAAVFRGQGGDKRRPPAGSEAMFGIERAQAGEAGVDDPELIVAVLGHFVDMDVAGDMNSPRQVAGVVRARGFELRCHGRDVTVIPYGVGAADREPRPIRGDPHGFAEGAEMSIKRNPVVAHDDDLAGLVGGDDETDV